MLHSYLAYVLIADSGTWVRDTYRHMHVHQIIEVHGHACTRNYPARLPADEKTTLLYSIPYMSRKEAALAHSLSNSSAHGPCSLRH